MNLHADAGTVVRPRSTPEVQEVLRVASRESIPVTPRGGGTGKAGGCIPTAGGIVLSLEKMNRINLCVPRAPSPGPAASRWSAQTKRARCRAIAP
jgi:FAD/FMN-containing dehydrogenase